MSELNEILKYLQSMDHRLESIEGKIEQLPTREEFQSLGRTTDEIASGLEEKAVKIQHYAFQVEDKAESGYLVLESLFQGMEDRVANIIRESEERMAKQMNQGFEQMGNILQQVLELNQKQDERITQLEDRVKDRFHQVTEQISALSDITRAWIYKGNLIEKEVQELKKKMSGDNE